MSYKKSILSFVLLFSGSSFVYPISFSIFSNSSVKACFTYEQLLQNKALLLKDVDVVQNVIDALNEGHFELSENDAVGIINFVEELHEYVLEFNKWFSKADCELVRLLAVKGLARYDAHRLVNLIKSLSGSDNINSKYVYDFRNDEATYFVFDAKGGGRSEGEPLVLSSACTVTLYKPKAGNRRAIIEDCLIAFEKSINNQLLDELVDLTSGCDGTVIQKMIYSIVKPFKEKQVDPSLCLFSLQKMLPDFFYASELSKKLTRIEKLLQDEGFLTVEIEMKVGEKTLDDICGNEDKIEYFSDFLHNRERGKIIETAGVIAKGPSGVGKTLIITIVCNELGYEMWYIKTPKLKEEGVSGSIVKKIELKFKEAKVAAKQGRKIALFLMK